jgi:hypothetical protein
MPSGIFEAALLANNIIFASASAKVKSLVILSEIKCYFASSGDSRLSKLIRKLWKMVGTRSPFIFHSISTSCARQVVQLNILSINSSSLRGKWSWAVYIVFKNSITDIPLSCFVPLYFKPCGKIFKASAILADVKVGVNLKLVGGLTALFILCY